MLIPALLFLQYGALNSALGHIFSSKFQVDKGQPEFVSEGPCQLYFIWKTTYACPPFEEVECTVEG